MIVSECDSLPNVKLWIDVLPMFNSDQTAIYNEYQLVMVRGNGKPKRVSIDPGVVEKALKKKVCAIVAAAVNQCGWLQQHCPEFDAALSPFILQKSTPKARKSGKPKRL